MALREGADGEPTLPSKRVSERYGRVVKLLDMKRDGEHGTFVELVRMVYSAWNSAGHARHTNNLNVSVHRFALRGVRA